jgi:uncharacterized membrane protein
MTVVGLSALVVAALFAGAALYVSVAEHPARLELDPAAQLTQWKPAYKRGAVMQASLALLGFVLGLAAFWQTRQAAFAAAAVVLVANWPYTLLVIRPVNDRLLATDPSPAGGETVELLRRWGALHGGRTALGLAAVAIFLYACASGP